MNYATATPIVTAWAAKNDPKGTMVLFEVLCAMDQGNVTEEEAKARDFLFDEMAAKWGK